MQRRALVGLLGLLGPGSWQQSFAQAPDTQRTRPATLTFPRDLGSHPDHAIEWWYITGVVQAADASQALYGFQLTFFRSRVTPTQNLRSRLAAKQLYMAHAAITDVNQQRLHADQRLARSAGHDGAFSPNSLDTGAASTEDTAVRCRDWSLQRAADGSYVARIRAREIALQLSFVPTQSLLLQGQAGWSRKGPLPHEASYYYTEPQLQVQGELQLQGRRIQANPAQSRAWLDHEWSQQIMPARAVGWDWIGMNLADGSALTAFQLRDAQGRAVWAGGSWRAGHAAQVSQARAFKETEVVFEPLEVWLSPVTGARYPVRWSVKTPHGLFVVQALVQAQELDSRRSTGAVYWEGLSELRNTQGEVLGRGYLEMTGYASALKL